MENQLNTICVYCAASSRVAPHYMETARKVGHLLADAKKHLVYGGGRTGLMGAVADGAREHGGDVTGIIPEFLAEREVAHMGLTKLYVVQTMHERQAMMENLAEAFLILPGGLGTLAEFFEVLTWKQLGHHEKPIVILNTNGFWNSLLDFLAQAEAEDFTHKGDGALWRVVEKVEDIPSALGFR